MQHKHIFLSWYFTHGARSFFATWVRVMRYIPHYFSFAILARTIFAPWHRDVSLKNWRGFNPLRSLERTLWNLFSRFIGAIVRVTTLGIGGIVFITFFVGGIIFFVLYFAFPLIVIVLTVLLVTPYWYIGIMLFFLTLFILWRAWVAYRLFYHKPYAQMTIMELAQQPWFDRVWERLGITKEELPPRALQDFSVFKDVLRAHDVTPDECQDLIAWETERQIDREQRKKIFSEAFLRHLRPIGRTWHYGYTVHLDRFVEDLTNKHHPNYMQAPFYGHQDEIEMLELVLSRPQENNAMLLGEPGIGRKTLVFEFARRVADQYYQHTALRDVRVLRIDLNAAVSYAQEQGADAEYVLHNLFHEAAYAGNVILVVEKFEQYMHEAQHGFSFSSIIEKYASLPTFRMIGISTEKTFHQSIENARALLGHFDVIHVKEMSVRETMKTLFMLFYNDDATVFTYQALREIVAVSTKYVQTAPLPKRAIDLAMEVVLDWKAHSTSPKVTVKDVLSFIRKKTGIPVGTIDTQEQTKLLGLEEAFHQHIVGQDEAVRVVANAVRRMRSGMARPHRPAGSFLFLGPTGVGKTEMAKTLATEYFGSADKVIRLDMSEYNGPQALARLIGSRAQNKKGHLTSLAQQHPYALLLLDEIEKATQEVLDIFLQILDEGIVHDAFGVKINFTTMIIIATSNAGSQLIVDAIKKDIPYDEMKKTVLETIISSGVFRPEFINRFDDIVVFHAMKPEEILRITQLLLEKFSARIAQEQNIVLTFDDDVISYIVKNGYDELYGARSILRFIDEVVADALAKKLIAGNIHRGEDVRFTIADLAG